MSTSTLGKVSKTGTGKGSKQLKNGQKFESVQTYIDKFRGFVEPSSDSLHPNRVSNQTSPDFSMIPKTSEKKTSVQDRDLIDGP